MQDAKRRAWKVGDKVRTRYKFSGRRRRGTIKRIDGAYIYVQLVVGYQIEAYPNELTGW